MSLSLHTRYWDYIEKYSVKEMRINDWDVFRVDIEDDPIKRKIVYQYFQNIKTSFCQWEIPQDILIEAKSSTAQCKIDIRHPGVVAARQQLEEFRAQFEADLVAEKLGGSEATSTHCKHKSGVTPFFAACCCRGSQIWQLAAVCV